MRRLLIPLKYFMILLPGIYSAITYAGSDGAEIFNDWYQSKNPGVSPVKFQQYNEICGNCHFPYQPGLLPAASWREIMSDTDNHFGKALTLSPVELNTMTRYLLDNSAGRVNDRISYDILQSLAYDQVIIEITKTPYFTRTHSQLDDKEKTRAIGQCDSCHQGAAQGKYQIAD